MTYEILRYPAAGVLLRRKARPVREEEFGTPALAEFCTRLGETMMQARGMGLAATQVEEAPGGEPWAIFTLHVAGNAWVAVCNPGVEVTEGSSIAPEGCLSFASVRVPMAAPGQVTLTGRSPTGAVGAPRYLRGDMARCAYHENQHLAGKLLIDRMSSMKRKVFLRDVERAWLRMK